MKNNSVPVITIDGPSGSGKGTIGKALAAKLGWHFLDSGAIYRIFAYAVIQKNVPVDDVVALVKLADSLESYEVTDKIRTEQCGLMASKIAVIPEVRAALVKFQHRIRKAPGLVADGRDMGTVVFPDATFKVFLTAAPEERAKRRVLQLQEAGINASLGAVLQDLNARDARDASRAVAPLKPADDAVVIDSTGLSINEVLKRILQRIEK